MTENRYPTEQMCPEQVRHLSVLVAILARNHGISEDVTQDMVRAGLEFGWNCALSTAGATEYSRILKTNTVKGGI